MPDLVDPVAVVADLIRQWRERAASQGAIYASGIAECADELDAVLPALEGLRQERERGELTALATAERFARYLAEVREVLGMSYLTFDELAREVTELITRADAAERETARLQAKVKALIGAETSPLQGHNERSWCTWCDAKWTKPDWKLEPQPEFFGHPHNDCLIWAAAPMTRPYHETRRYR